MNTEKPSKKENIAIVAVTVNGVILGRRLQQQLPGSHLYVPQKRHISPDASEHPYTSPVTDLVSELFHCHRYLILIMAMGIAVRAVAGNARDKRSDPGVVVIDDAGTFCISLLSGHIGGANELAEKTASLLGAQPVITTASDVNNTLSLDLLGKEFGWEIEDDTHLKSASAALVNGEPVGVFQDAGEPDWQTASGMPLPENITVYDSLKALQAAAPRVALLITDRVIENQAGQALPDFTVIYRPKSLVLGIGCNRGTGSEAIASAVDNTLSRHELSSQCVKTIATIDLKKDEAGLLKYARQNRLPLDYHDRESLRRTKFPSPPSQAAIKHLGTPSVCEGAALLTSCAPALIIPKTSHGRSVTVAVARLAFSDTHVTEEKGQMFFIGIGPGDLKQMTFAARDALDRSQVVVGYKTYIKLIKPLVGRKLVIATGMGSEIDRVKTAVDFARQGKTVAIISGGDSGIYGMAGTMGEYLRQQTVAGIEITVIPGVPALVACAALLGSPVSNDFVSISLSNYLVPWELIRTRLEMAARGEFVIVLYNPRSNSRRQQLTEAIEIITRYRPPHTPAGIVTNAYRPGQAVTLTDLEHLQDNDIGMNTSIIIGNSNTFTGSGWLVTPRGYSTKYELGKSNSVK